MYMVPAVTSPTDWAERTFATVDLKDRRRDRRAVTLAASMMRHPNASLPQQLGAPSALKAAYRLLDQDDVTHAALSQPHWEATRDQARRQNLVLLIQDTTEIDHSHYLRAAPGFTSATAQAAGASGTWGDAEPAMRRASCRPCGRQALGGQTRKSRMPTSRRNP